MNLVCFADDQMTISQGKLIESALKNGVTATYDYGKDHISNEFLIDNKDIFSHSRGVGYWLWKPYFIYKALQDLQEDEFLFYSDSGLEIIGNLNYIKDQMIREGEDVFLFSGRFPHHEWCKMDIIKLINNQNLTYYETQSGPIISMNGYESFMQVQASNIFIRKNKETMDFVKEWLLFCQMPGLIDDSPSKAANSPTFQENRHDQAILTCLAIKYSIRLHWFPSTTNLDRRYDFNDSYPPLFDHHRKRNSEW